MAARYFDKFPTITYANTTALDITKRTTILNTVNGNPHAFYPYELDVFERPDQFSNRYYNDSYKSWILYLSNQIVDPYYEWYLQENEFYDLLDKKYGSSVLAQRKTMFYRHNWVNVDDISVSNFDALPYSLKRYWHPNYGASNQILSYSRIKADWSITTNKTVVYSVANTSGFVKDELCNIVFDTNDYGSGQVLDIVGNNLYMQHVSGTFVPNTTVIITGSSYIYGTENNSNTIFVSAAQIANNLAIEEEVYWSPVTYYDYENAKNEYNKSIKILDNRLTKTIVNDLTKLMAE